MEKVSLVAISQNENLVGSPTDLGEESLNSVATLVEKAISKSCNFSHLVKDKTVLIKPNLVRSTPENIFATTDIRVIYSVAKMALETGANKVIIGEKPGWKKSARSVFEELGVDKIACSLGVQTCFFDEDQLVEVDLPTAKIFNKVFVPKTLMDSDVLINLPKVKTHMHTIVSLGIKNLHGIVMDNQRLINHRNDIGYKLVDILRVKKPSLTVSDCIWPMEGQGPLNGQNIKDFNVIIAGTDVVAVDAVTCSIMSIDPSEVDAIRIANAEGLGNGELEKIETVGQKIAELKRHFKRACISSAGVYPNILSMEGGACQGCLSCVRHSLDRLAFEKQLQHIEKITVCCGKHSLQKNELFPAENDLWLVGDCASQIDHSQNLRKEAHRVTGCPPHIYDFYNKLCRRYFEK